MSRVVVSRWGCAKLWDVFIGAGTVINVATVLVGGLLGVLIGGRLPERTSRLITQVLGLFTLVLGGYAIGNGLSTALSAEVGAHAGLLIVLGALLLGALVGAGVRLEDRLDAGAAWVQKKLAREQEGPSRFAEAAVTATLVFCVGPLAILGSLSDGLGHGAQQLIVKSMMDGFAATAFAASLGIGVVVSILPLALYQGAWTLLGWGFGAVLTAGQVDALGAAGGIILLGLGIRLIGLARIRVGDLLPALAIAPTLVWIVSVLR